MRICATCAVEFDEPVPDVCPICEDERQWMPAEGQIWTSIDELAGNGQRLTVHEVEPDMLGIRADPGLGIGQLMTATRTSAGVVLWDPTGYADEATADRIRQHGEVIAIATSHPHMYGVQLEWSSLLGDVPVLACAADREWLGRKDDRIEFWSGEHRVADDYVLHQVGGHFVGSAVAHWAAGAEGRGVLLVGDTVFPNPDRRTISFQRSYPNRLPLSGAVVDRITTALEGLDFDRVYGNFGNCIERDARQVLRASADRHIGWVRGDFDHLT
ncbi:hydrolase [Nakamurella sp. YIM 132087]|uniref:Hydrolase n=1 Tax=Nakamurella alba TaxID=2665158 RepID=A0A7K1FM72_9ACTN|nr:hydrolase [Nakamurella alba]MTD14419.1 hydrolase [Nakamurella alba]